ncbi:GNAT family acetyltransferase [Microbaculum sp. FT89]|uniref:GNAT family acetyltransferase n=1 Tax=Microbaculum sp. FT89 TaxID=3447298 RepID=UPI003F52C6C9
MPKLSVTEITDADVDAVADLWARCGLTRPWNDPRADIAFARAAPSSTILVGRADGAIAASAMVGHDGHRGTVYYVCVDPRRQGEGLGREIMAAAEDWLRGQGVWKLNLMVRTDNARVIEFYKSVGYDVEERVNMAKWLDPSKKPA